MVPELRRRSTLGLCIKASLLLSCDDADTFVVWLSMIWIAIKFVIDKIAMAAPMNIVKPALP